MLPKISEENAHRRLKRELGIKSATPKSLNSHWQIFKEIAHHPNFNTGWYTELLLFSKNWLDTRNNKKWLKFHNFLLETAWAGTHFWRNQVLFNLVFSRAQRTKNLRPNPYLADTVKHLIAIATGAAPGFAAADDEIAAPVFAIEKAYSEIYHLRQYAPAIMHPYHFDMSSQKPVYYSLRYPTSFEFSPTSRNISSVMQDLHEVKHILDAVMEILSDNEMNLENYQIFNLAEKIELDFFHSEKDRYHEVRSSAEIIESDPALQRILARQPGKIFCENSPFFRGCIQMHIPEK